MPHVRICAGGAGRPAFLPRPGRWTEFMQLRMLTPRDRMLVEGQARFILELWNAGRYADLLSPQNALAPGWK